MTTSAQIVFLREAWGKLISSKGRGKTPGGGREGKTPEEQKEGVKGANYYKTPEKMTTFRHRELLILQQTAGGRVPQLVSRVN